MIKIINTDLKGFVIIETKCFQDSRGFFLETYNEEIYKKAGIKDKFVQDNQSRSNKGVLRGMHFQLNRPQAQIVTVLNGSIYDVGVDLRLNSATFGKSFGVFLSDGGQRQIYMAPGFAHGFCVLSDIADLHYKVSRFYDPKDECGLHWKDSDVNIQWPSIKLNINERDQNYNSLATLKSNDLLPQDPPLERE
jgi:dTDP-4-dehydrorhamnose 3,5-epimerase